MKWSRICRWFNGICTFVFTINWIISFIVNMSGIENSYSENCIYFWGLSCMSAYFWQSGTIDRLLGKNKDITGMWGVKNAANSKKDT